jgi:hypothetical protein
MRNTADVANGKPIAVLLQFISGLSAINPLVTFYDIHGGKTEVQFFYLCVCVCFRRTCVRMCDKIICKRSKESSINTHNI